LGIPALLGNRIADTQGGDEGLPAWVVPIGRGNRVGSTSRAVTAKTN
jgi:hypothetical protein